MAIREEFVLSLKDRTKAGFASISSSLRKVTSRLGTVSAVAGGAAVFGFIALQRESFKTIDTLAKTARKLGTTTESLSALRSAAELTGVSSGVLDKGLQNLVRNIADFSDGTGEAKAELEKLGFAQKDLINLKTDEQFAAIAERLRGVENATERVNIAYSLFGGRATALLNTLSLSQEEFEQIAKDAKAFGIALSEVDAAKIEQANDQMQKVGEVITGLSNKIAVQLAPVITKMANRFIEAARESNGFEQETSNGIDFLVDKVGFLADSFRGLKVVFKLLEVGFAVFSSFVVARIADLDKTFVAFANKIPFLDGKFKENLFIQTWAREAEARFKGLNDELDVLINKPLPGNELISFINEIRSGEDKTLLPVKPDNVPVLSNIVKSDDMKLDEALQNQLTRLEEGFFSQEEMLFNAAERRQFIIEDSFQRELIGDARRIQLLEKNEVKHQKALTQFKVKGEVERLNITAGILGSLSQIVGTESKKQFDKSKKLSIAETTVATFAGAQRAFAETPGGIFVQIAAAAAALLAGFARVKKIRGTSFGGGGSASGGGGVGFSASGGGTGNFGNLGPTQPSPFPGQQETPDNTTGGGNITTITLVGEDQTTFTRDQVNSLIEGLKEAVNRNDQIIFDTDSRQADEIRQAI